MILVLKSHFCVEPPDHDGRCFKTLLGDNFQEWNSISIVSFIHFSDD